MSLKNRCLLCNHRWKAMYNRKPLQCPKCKRYDWDKVKEIKETEKKPEVKEINKPKGFFAKRRKKK